MILRTGRVDTEGVNVRTHHVANRVVNHAVTPYQRDTGKRAGDDIDPKMSEWVLKSFKKTEDQVCRLIERGQDLGQFKSKDKARRLAQFILNTTQGMQLLAKVNQDRKMLKGIARTAMSSLINP